MGGLVPHERGNVLASLNYSVVLLVSFYDKQSSLTCMRDDAFEPNVFRAHAHPWPSSSLDVELSFFRSMKAHICRLAASLHVKLESISYQIRLSLSERVLYHPEIRLNSSFSMRDSSQMSTKNLLPSTLASSVKGWQLTSSGNWGVPSHLKGCTAILAVRIIPVNHESIQHSLTRVTYKPTITF